MCFFPSMKNCTLATKNASSPHSFWSRWLKLTFCRELDCLDRHIRSFCVFDLFQVRKHNTTKKCNLKKKLEVFLNFIIQKFKQLGMWRPAVWKWNKITTFVYLWNRRWICTFCRNPISLYFLSKSFSLRFTEKTEKQTFHGNSLLFFVYVFHFGE